MNLRQTTLLLLLVLLPVAGGALSAQEDRFDRRDESPEVGHVPDAPQSEPEPAPSEPPPDSSGSSSPETPTETPVEPPSETPEEPPSETPGRYAVPVTELPEPHRQPPSRDRRDPRPSGGGDDGGYFEEEPVEVYEDWSDEVPGGYPGQAVRGGLDLDLSPGRTQVYVNGRYVGIVDQYDGWPSYLLLPEGTYDLVFYLDGFRTLARRVAIYPGALVKMNDRLEPGLSIPPEDFLYDEIGSER